MLGPNYRLFVAATIHPLISFPRLLPSGVVLGRI
jgi:hypothetical protein